MKLRILLLTVAACLMSSCGGGPKGEQPVPVTILNPETKPELNLNGFLLSNGTVLGCQDFLAALPESYFAETTESARAKTTGGVDSIPDPLDEHNEPPIGGEDGSFRLYMNVMRNLSGSTAKRHKLCAQAEHPHGSWKLHWKRWDAQGNAIPQSSRAVAGIPLETGKKVKISLTDATGTEETVEIVREQRLNGTAWESTTSAKFGPKKRGGQLSSPAIGVGTYFELDVPNAAAIRMSKIEIIDAAGAISEPISLSDDKSPNSCTGFIICHDGKRCQIPVPSKCVNTATPGGNSGHVH